MQTKKRAKPVKFGSDNKKQTVAKKEDLEERIPEKITTKELAEEQEPVVELTPVEENIDTAQEIKQEIEKKIHPKEEGEETEEVHLTAEEVSDSDEVEPKADEQEEQRKAAFGSFTNDFSEKPKKTGNVRFFLAVLVITFFTGLLIIEAFYFFTTNKKLSPPDNPLIALMKPTATPTAAPSPTPKVLNLAAYSIKVLNGSGITGEAAKVKTTLTDAKFKVDTVGNADAEDYTKTEIAAKKSVDKAYLAALTAILAKTYVVDTKIATLSEANSADVIVTIGSTPAN